MAVARRPPTVNAEAAELHTRLQKLTLAVDASRAYWANADPAEPPADQALRAFEERWFGSASQEWIRRLLADLRARYDAFPEALAVLGRWRDMTPATRRLICHWHLQLADPLYRRCTAELLVARRAGATPELDRPVVERWVAAAVGERWRPATVTKFSRNLLTTAAEAGLVTPPPDPRRAVLPSVPDIALGYLLHLLRTVEHTGSVSRNPYLASVGIGADALHRRIAGVAGVSARRLGDVESFEWHHATLGEWAAEAVR